MLLIIYITYWIACTTTVLNSSEISFMKLDICFISLSTLLSLPVYEISRNTTYKITLFIIHPIAFHGRFHQNKIQNWAISFKCQLQLFWINQFLGFDWLGLVWWCLFNATFNNISVISWWSVLLVEETRGPRENHRPAALKSNVQERFFFNCIK